MSHSHDSQRRRFLQRAAAMSGMGAALPFGLNMSALTQAAAQSTGGGYKALVCLFFNGGNDAFNTVLATDSDSWGHYLHHRRPASTTGGPTAGTPIALMEAGTPPNSAMPGNKPERLGGVLPINHAGRAAHGVGRTFALHPALTKLQQIHNEGRACVLANVGPLTRPTTKADYADLTKSRPPKLFSHNDQQSIWQSFNPEGASQGWGGLMADTLRGLNGVGRSNAADSDIIQKSFTCMSPGQSPVWLAGKEVQPYQSSGTNILSLGSGGKIYNNTGLQAAVANVMGGTFPGVATPSTGVSPFVQDQQALVQRALKASALLADQLAPLGDSAWSDNPNPYIDPRLQYTSPADGVVRLNGAAMQLQMIARLIATNSRANLGITRQFFMVNMGGFDSHSNQVADHADRMAQLDHALAYFNDVLQHMPGGDMSSMVTTFTASDFGRTFTSNGDGTDHGWGAHHIIMGGAVNGAEVYGTFPKYSSANSAGVFSSYDQIQNGVLIPTTSVDQYAYTLGKWMGVSDANMVGNILPNLPQFSSAGYNLGFMKS